jgi:hypothetical protein
MRARRGSWTRRDPVEAHRRDLAGTDHVAMVLHNRRAGTDCGFIGLVRTVLADFRRSGARTLAVLTGLSLASVAITLAQVLVGASALDGLTEGGIRDLATLAEPLVALAILTVFGLAVGSATTQVERLLGQQVLRDTERRILDITTTVPLAAYESPEFLTLLTRVLHNAVIKPLDLVRGVIAVLTGTAAVFGLGLVLIGFDPLLLPLLAATALPVYLVNRAGGKREFAFAVEHAASLSDYRAEMAIRQNPVCHAQSHQACPRCRRCRRSRHR